MIFTGRDRDRVEIAEKEYAKDFGESVTGFALGSLDPAGRADEASVKKLFAACADNTTGAELTVDGGNSAQLYPIKPPRSS